MKKEKIPKNIATMLGIIGVLAVLLIISFIFNLKDNSDMSTITGSSIKETVVCNENYIRFGESCCLDLNKNNICDKDEETQRWLEEKQALENKIKELEAKIKETEEQEQIKKEVCSITCGRDEICAAVNKADGSVKWLCVDDPEKLLGPNG